MFRSRDGEGYSIRSVSSYRGGYHPPECPQCGAPMDKKDDRLVCKTCGYTITISRNSGFKPNGKSHRHLVSNFLRKMKRRTYCPSCANRGVVVKLDPDNADPNRGVYCWVERTYYPSATLLTLREAKKRARTNLGLYCQECAWEGKKTKVYGKYDASGRLYYYCDKHNRSVPTVSLEMVQTLVNRVKQPQPVTPPAQPVQQPIVQNQSAAVETKKESTGSSKLSGLRSKMTDYGSKIRRQPNFREKIQFAIFNFMSFYLLSLLVMRATDAVNPILFIVFGIAAAVLEMFRVEEMPG